MAAAGGDRPMVAAVIQDDRDGRVLMVGWMDDEALEATRRTGLVHFHSRSRDRLWQKGETSGNVLHVRTIEEDCDGDALLIAVEPAGPTCHTGARSCFDDPTTDASGPDAPADRRFGQLDTLWATIAERRERGTEASYTARLLSAGVDEVARKVVEEATEVLIAAKDDATTSTGDASTRQRLAEESADLLYHLLVLLTERDLDPSEVMAVLRARAGVRG